MSDDEDENPEAPSEDRAGPLELRDLFIRTKERGLIPLVPNEPQVKYLDLIAPDWRGGNLRLRKIREILLKARQEGFSTLIAALFFLDTIEVPNTVTVVIANDRENTEKLFRMVQLFYKHLPVSRQPRTQYASRREFYWPDLNSSYYVGTAGDRDFGRSSTINNLHCTEVAFWPDAKRIMTGLLQAVPGSGNVFIETTANGLGDWYHTEYVAAQAGKSSYTPRFFAWFELGEYASDVPLAEIPVTDDDRKTELELQDRLSLTDFQISWRRQKRREPGMREKFPQEYPATPAEAFLLSGNPYYDRDILNARLIELQADPREIEFEVPDKYENLGREAKWLRLYAMPVEGRAYVVSADTAEGLNLSGDHDHDSSSVWDAETWEQVAHLHGQWDTHLYGVMLAELGFWFGTALLVIERNNHGHAVINGARHGGGYPDMKPGECSGLYLHEEYDERKKLRQMRPGYPTTSKSKYFMLDELDSAINEGDLIINAPESVTELMNYVKLPGGKAGGEAGSHDDRVIDCALGATALRMQLITKRHAISTGLPTHTPSPIAEQPTAAPVGTRAGSNGAFIPPPTRAKRSRIF